MSDKKKSKLRVVPVKRYNRAKYPAFNDPNPIDHPDTLPYPFSEKVFKILCSMGFTGALLLGSPDEAEAINPEVITLEERDSTGNPFTLEMTGLPFMPASFGTGLPSRLRREESMEVINRVFREEGIKLDSMVDINRDGVIATAEGYNEEMKIGYVYIDYLRQGEGTTMNRRDVNRASKFNDEYIIEQRYGNLEMYTKKDESIYKRLIKEDKPQTREFVKFIDEVYPTLNSLSQPHRLKRAYLKYTLYNTLENSEADYPEFSKIIHQHLDNNTGYTVEQVEKYLFTVYLLRQIKGGFPQQAESVMINELIGTVQSPGKDWAKLMNNAFLLINLKSIAANTKNEALRLLVEEAFTKSKKAREDVFKKIDAIVDLIKIDLEEIEKIDAAANQNKYFLAPISQRDHRFAYPYMHIPTKEQIQRIEQRLAEETDPKRKEQLEKQIADMKEKLAGKKEDPREKTLKMLEDQVRNYIHWAKSQMGY